MNKLNKGQESLFFKAKNYLGEDLNLNDYRGKNVLLSFHVFALCPFCNLTINELRKKYQEEYYAKTTRDNLPIARIEKFVNQDLSIA